MVPGDPADPYRDFNAEWDAMQADMRMPRNVAAEIAEIAHERENRRWRERLNEYFINEPLIMTETSSDLKNPDVLAVNLPGEFLDKLTRYAQEDTKLAKLAAFDPVDRDQYLAQQMASRQWAEAAIRVLLCCLNPPHGTALAVAKLASSDAWLKAAGDAPVVFVPDALERLEQICAQERQRKD